MKRVDAEQEAQRRALYEQGLNDIAIAAALNVSRTTIYQWRKARGLPTAFPRGRVNRKDQSQPVLTAELKATCISLLRKGVGIKVVARELDVSEKSLTKWRLRMLKAEPELRLPHTSRKAEPRSAAGRTYCKMAPDRRRHAFSLYADGLTDRAIAERIGVAPRAIWQWRAAFRLGVNAAVKVYKPKPVKAAPFVPISARTHPVYAAMVAAIGKGIAADLADDAISDMWLALEEGRLAAAGIAAAAGKFRSRAITAYANPNQRSIDEALPGTDDMRMIDMLRDERSSSWLEEMGATVW